LCGGGGGRTAADLTVVNHPLKPRMQAMGLVCLCRF
jgi:hypothetical protein